VEKCVKELLVLKKNFKGLTGLVLIPYTASGGQIKSWSPAMAKTGTLILQRWSLYKNVPLLSRKPPSWKADDNCKRSLAGMVPVNYGPVVNIVNRRTIQSL